MELKIIHDPNQMVLSDVRTFIECFRQLCLATNVHHIEYIGDTPVGIHFNDGTMVGVHRLYKEAGLVNFIKLW